MMVSLQWRGEGEGESGANVRRGVEGYYRLCGCGGGVGQCGAASGEVCAAYGGVGEDEGYGGVSFSGGFEKD